MAKGIFYLVIPFALMGFRTHFNSLLLASGLVGSFVKLFLAGPAPWNPKYSGPPLHKDL